MSLSPEAARIYAVVGADISRLEASYARAEAATRDLALKMERTLDASMAHTERSLATRGAAMTTRLRAISAAMTKAFTIPALVVVGGGFKLFTDYQQQLIRIKAETGSTAKEMALANNTIMKSFRDLPQAPKALAEALYHARSLIPDMGKALNLVHTSALGAATGLADLTDMTNALGGAIFTGIKGVANYHNAMTSLFAIAGVGNMTMQDLANSMGSGFLSIAARYGVSLKNIGAALAVMTDSGMSAEAGATRLRMAMSLLGSPTKQAVAAFHQIGMGQHDLAISMQGPDGLLGAIKLLKAHLDDYTKGMAKAQASAAQNTILTRAFGGARSASALATLLQMTDRYAVRLKLIDLVQREYAAAIAATQQTAAYKLKVAWANVERALITVGAAVAPTMLMLASGLRKAADWFQSLSNSTKKWLAISLGILALVGPFAKFILLMWELGKVAKTVMTAMGLLSAAEVALGPAAVAGGAVAEAELAAIGTAAGGAAVEVGLLGGKLAGLAGLGVLAAPLAILGALQAPTKAKNYQGTSTGALVYQGAGGQWMQKFGRAGVRKITPAQAAALGATIGISGSSAESMGHAKGGAAAASQAAVNARLNTTLTPEQIAQQAIAKYTADMKKLDAKFAKTKMGNPNTYGNHKGPKGSGGGSGGSKALGLATHGLDAEQTRNAQLAYAYATKHGLSPTEALDFAQTQKGESNFHANALNKKSGAAGLYQLLSSGYVNKANAMGGVMNPLANIASIFPDYADYYRNHPFSKGAAGSAVERSGMGASYYQQGYANLSLAKGGFKGSTLGANALKTPALASVASLMSVAKSWSTLWDSMHGKTSEAQDTIASLNKRMKDVGKAILSAATPAEVTKAKNQMASIKQAWTDMIAALKQKVDDAKPAFEQAFGVFTSMIDQMFQKITDNMVAALRVDVTTKYGTFNYGTGAYGQADKTPGELALKALQDQQQAEADRRARDDAAKSVADAQKKYNDALAAAGGSGVSSPYGAQQGVSDNATVQSAYDSLQAAIQSQTDVLRQQSDAAALLVAQARADEERAAADYTLQQAQARLTADQQIKQNALDSTFSELASEFSNGIISKSTFEAAVKAAIGAAGIEPGKAASLMGQVFSDALNLSLGTLESTVMTLAKAINEWLVAQGKTPLDTSGSFVTASGPSAYGMTPAQTASWVAGTLSYGDAQAISSKTHIAIPMASGGMGRVTRPTNFLAGEAGAEDYLFSGGGKSFADIFSGGGGGDTYVLEATIPVLVDGKQVAVTTQTQLLRKKGRGAKLALA